METTGSEISAAPPPSYQIDFKAGGQGQEFLIAGWSYPEKDYSWTLGTQSVLRLPHLAPETDYALLFRGGPMVREGLRSFQRLIVLLNGVVLAQLVARAPGQFELFVPAAAIGEGEVVEVVFQLPDATAPSDLGGASDTRTLGWSMVQLELKPLATQSTHPDATARAADVAILMDIQSLGINCELGFVQRHFGAEPFGLFRWAFTPLPNLLRALDARFEGFGAAGNLDVWIDDASEFHVLDKRYGFKNHSFAFQNAGAKKDDILRREAVRIPFLVRLLIEDLESSTKLFCFHDTDISSAVEVEELVKSINLYGSNYLLWIRRATSIDQVGNVEAISEKLLCGYIDEFQPIVNVKMPSLSSWMSVCKAAHAFWCNKRVS